jgi:hypothetical protein
MPIRGVVLIQRPEAATSISEIAEVALRRAGVVGTLPTPMDEIIAAAKLKGVTDPEAFIRTFMAGLQQGARAVFRSALQKLRGIADLREKAIYVPRDTNDRRVLFAKGHEAGHQLIPWHNVNTAYQDDDLSLSPEAQECFDQEANFFAAEVIFQGGRFASRVRDYKASLEAAFQLADDHGASRHATLWRYVEEQDEAVSLAAYFPSRYTADQNGSRALCRGRVVGSPRFISKFASVDLPRQLPIGHPWAAARDLGTVCEGEMSLPCAEGPTDFQWQAWWNTYRLFVLLRRKPLLSLVGRLVRP